MKNPETKVAQVDARHAMMAEEIQSRLSVQGEMAARLVAVIKAVDDSRFCKQDTDTVSLVILALELARSLEKDINQIETRANGLAVDMCAAHEPNSQPKEQGQRPPSIDVAVLTLIDWADWLASAAHLMDEIKGELKDNPEFQKIDHLFLGAVALLDDAQESVLSYEPHQILKALKVAA